MSFAQRAKQFLEAKLFLTQPVLSLASKAAQRIDVFFSLKNDIVLVEIMAARYRSDASSGPVCAEAAWLIRL